MYVASRCYFVRADVSHMSCVISTRCFRCMKGLKMALGAYVWATESCLRFPCLSFFHMLNGDNSTFLSIKTMCCWGRNCLFCAFAQHLQQLSPQIITFTQIFLLILQNKYKHFWEMHKIIKGICYLFCRILPQVNEFARKRVDFYMGTKKIKEGFNIKTRKQWSTLCWMRRE